MKITKELVVPNYGLEGTQGPDGKPAIYTTVTNQNIVLNAPYQGLPSDYSKANGSIQVFEGDKEVTQQATYTLKQTLNVAATLDFNKFKVTHVSTDNGMFIVTVSYKEFVSDIMITTNVVRNGQSGQSSYIHRAWSWSADGTDRFTTKYPNENLSVGVSLPNMKEISMTTAQYYVQEPTGIRVKAGVKYVYSIEGYAKDGQQVLTNLGLGKDSGGFVFDITPHQLLTKNRVQRAFTVTQSQIDQFGDFLTYRIRNDHKAMTVVYGKVKIEEGTNATIYTPSPKDDFDNAWPKYEGYYSSHNPVQSTNPSDYTWSVIRGDNGVGVKSTVIRYAINTQGDTPPSTGWVSQVPTLVKGQFLWTETTWTYTDNTSEKGYSVTYISKDGNNGTDGIAGKDGVGIKTTTFKYGISTSGTTKPSNWSTNIPTVPEGQFLWTETTWTYTDNTSEKGYSVAKQGAKGPKGDTGPQGDPGQDGPPTGIIESPTIPTEVYQGMLWKNTGNLSGFITDVTYIYRGSKWEKYIFTADNIYADNLSAITANLGDVTGGSFTGGKFINNFVDVPLLYNGTSKATGQTKIENGQITIAGKIDNTFNFVTKYTVDAISSTIYYPNSDAVMKMFSITPDGFLLADHQNGFSGQLLASSLTKTPWVDIPMRSGYSGASHNMPKYKITYNLDGTRTISFRGQIVKTSSAGVIDMEAGTDHMFGDLPTSVRPNVEANGYGVTSSGNGCRVWAYTNGGMGCRIGVSKTTYVDLSNLSYIID